MEINTHTPRQIGSGIYLVIDPAMDKTVLLDKLQQCLTEKLVAVQLWDHFRDQENQDQLISKICELCHAQEVPVLINNQWELLNNSLLDGVHFDQIPENYTAIQEKIGKPFISGLTCTNDLNVVAWASAHQLDYISFCSMFPSSTANSCELVNFDTVHQVAEQYEIPIFLAGGIKPENMSQLSELDYTGIAVVSGIMSTDKPNESIQNYQRNLKNISL